MLKSLFPKLVGLSAAAAIACALVPGAASATVTRPEYLTSPGCKLGPAISKATVTSSGPFVFKIPVIDGSCFTPNDDALVVFTESASGWNQSAVAHTSSNGVFTDVSIPAPPLTYNSSGCYDVQEYVNAVDEFSLKQAGRLTITYSGCLPQIN